MEVGALHQVAQSFRLERRQAGVTYFPTTGQQAATSDEEMKLDTVHCGRCLKSNSRVGLKVAVVDGLDQLLGDFDDLLLAG